jgi:hypothetical protein
MRRLLIGLVFALSAMFVAVASAAKPLQEFEIRWDGTVTEVDEFLSEACGFEVRATSRGHIQGKVYVDNDGAFKRFVAHPSFTTIYESDFASFESSDRGVDKVTENPDGTLSIHGTGIHFRVKGEAFAIGLWRLVVDPVAEVLLSAEYHGNFDLEEPDIVPFICERLGPP